MKIRLANESDLPKLQALSEAADSAARWTEQQWLEIFQTQIPARFAWIAETMGVENEPQETGFLVAQNIGPEWDLENIAVLPGFRRQGVGLELLSALLTQARSLRAERILLEVRASNQSAIRFYQASGFQLLAERREYYRNPVEDALILEYLFIN
jgi:[ribosomal protein S18]-alanine N-acetyltransferase